MTRDDPFDLVGDVLDGQFRVDAFVDEGDLSVIYKGHHVVIDAPVAIKCLNLPETLDVALVGPLVESFREASRVHYRLARGSLHIAQSLGAGQTMAPRTGATILYTVREWFEGQSLEADLLRRRSAGEKGRHVDEAVALLEPALEGIAYAHGKGLSHLSLSPSNLFIAEHDGKRSLKVLDFGVAATMNELPSESPLNAHQSAGLRLLFPVYAAPEQLDRTIGEMGPWTDVYAIALVLMELLSDRIVMHERETGVLVSRALDEVHRPTPTAHGLRVSRNVDMVLKRALSLAPQKRQKDADVFWRELKSAVRGTPSRQIPRTTTPPPRASMPTLLGVAPAPGPPELPRIEPRRSSSPSKTIPVPRDDTQPLSSLVPEPPPQIVTAKLPPPPPTPLSPEWAMLPANPSSPLPAAWPLAVQQSLASRRLLVLSAAVLVPMAVVVAILVVVLARPSRNETPLAATQASSSPTASTSTAPVASLSGSIAPVSRGTASVIVSTSTARFSVFAAKQALDGLSRDVATCKRGPKWGVAFATITFANDGSVDHVVIGPPFANTPTGECVSNKISTVHVPAFGGPPAVHVAQFYVSPH